MADKSYVDALENWQLYLWVLPLIMISWCCLIILWFKIIKQRKLTDKPNVFTAIVIDKKKYRKRNTTNPSYIIKCLFNCDPLHAWNEKALLLVKGYIKQQDYENLFIPTDIIHLITSFYITHDIMMDNYISDSIVEVYQVEPDEYKSVDTGACIDILCDKTYPKLFNAPRFEVNKYAPKLELGGGCAALSFLWLLMLIFLPIILNGSYNIRILDASLLFFTFNIFSCIVGIICCGCYKFIVDKMANIEFRNQYEQISQNTHDDDHQINLSEMDGIAVDYDGDTELTNINLAIAKCGMH